MKAIQAVPGSEEYQARIDEIQDNLRDYQDNPHLVQSPEEPEKLERKIRGLTEELAALITGRCRRRRASWLRDGRIDMKNHASAGVWIRTAGGYEIWIKARYFRRKGKRSGKRRYRGFYLGLLLLGINERCTSGFGAEVSLLAAMLGSLAEAREVLAERGARIDIKVLRRFTCN
jgi:hypothetical protein